MGENDAPADSKGQEAKGDGGGFQPITSQDELNRIIGERVSRERAKYADYDELRAKAARLDELEQANKSELEKVSEAAAKAAERAARAEAEALRWRVAAKHRISDEDAELFLTGTDEETLTKQAQRLAERLADSSDRKGNHVPREGRPTPPPKPSDEKQAVAKLFGSPSG